MGYRRCRPAFGATEALWVGDCSQRPHPPDRAEGGRQHDFPHGEIDCISAARRRRGSGPWATEGATRAASPDVRPDYRFPGRASTIAGFGRRHARRCCMSRLALLGFGLLAACSGAAAPPAVPPAASRTEATIVNFHFVPAALAIAAGSSVAWVNKDEDVH